MTASRKEDKMEAETRQRKKEVEEAERVVFAPGVTAGKLRRFKAALISSLPCSFKRR